MNLDTALPLLADDPSADFDLAELALAVARDEYPNLDLEAELAELAGLARELKPRLKGGLRARVEALCRYLFHEMGLEGNTQDYYDPRNSYLNEVLTRRTGLPISLSVIAVAIGTRAGLNVAGVGLPGHFIAKAFERGQEVYFDPFHGGRLLSPADCEALVEQVAGTTFQATPDALSAVAVGHVVQRILTNLKGSYLRLREFAKAGRIIGRLIQLCPGDVTQRRDMGAVLLQAGRPGQAIDHLEAYLGGDPPPEDHRSVGELLGQARGEVAQWN